MQKRTGRIGKNGAHPASEPLDLLGPLRTREGAQEELDFVLREGEAADLNLVLMAIAKAQGGLSKLARDTGLSRENLYGALSYEGKPRFETIQQIVRALGLQFTVEPLRAKRRVTKSKSAPIARRASNGSRKKRVSSH